MRAIPWNRQIVAMLLRGDQTGEGGNGAFLGTGGAGMGLHLVQDGANGAGAAPALGGAAEAAINLAGRPHAAGIGAGVADLMV